MDIFGIPTDQHLITAISFIVISVISVVFRKVVLKFLDDMASKTNAILDDVVLNAVHSIKNWFYYVLALYISVWLFIDLPKESAISDIFNLVIVVLITYQIIVAITSTIDFFVRELKQHPEGHESLVSVASTVSGVLKVLVWVLGILILLSNLGVEVSALLAGLGIGGLAFAFASQKMIADVFSAIVIFIDKPLSVGDFVTIGSNSGTVEKIGLKTTRIRAATGEEIIIPNDEITGSQIENARSRKERRFSFVIHLDYKNSAAKIKKASELIEKVVTETKQTRFLRSYLDRFEDAGIAIEYVFYIESTSYDIAVEKIQEIQLGIFEEFNKSKIEFSDPLQR